MTKYESLRHRRKVCDKKLFENLARVVEWLMASDCKSDRLTPYIGSNPIPCTKSILDFGFRISDMKAVLRVLTMFETRKRYSIRNPQSKIQNRSAGVAQW